MKNIYIVVLMSLALLFNGCKDDFLETTSTQTVDEQAVFNDTQSAMLAVNGLHKLMWIGDLSSSAFYGGYDMLMIWYEVMGDDLVYTYSNAQFKKQAQWSSHRNATNGSSTHFYRLLQYFISNSSMIIDHIGIEVADCELSKAFFCKALAPLGIEVVMEVNGWVGLGKAGKPDFWFGKGGGKQTPMHIAFTAENRAQVRAFYEAALAAGGRDNGPPGIREIYHPNYYGAFVIGPDDHNVEAVCHLPE